MLKGAATSATAVRAAPANSLTRWFCTLPSTHAIAAPHERAMQPVTYASHSSKSFPPLPCTLFLLYTSST